MNTACLVIDFLAQKFRFFLFASCVVILLFSCNNAPKDKATISSNPKIANLKMPDGFYADHLYEASKNGDGSWVSMTFDGKGRILASDQYGAIYRLQVPPIGDTVTKVKIEKLNIPTNAASVNDTSQARVSIGYAHGLLWAFNSLYVMINHNKDSAFEKESGLYRLQDTNGDDQFDKITLLKELEGEGEHGPHSIVPSPDGKSLFVIAGNFTKIPDMDASRNPAYGELDNLLPLIKDPNGHDNTVNWHGGWIAQIDPEGSRWELIASGFRNPFDLAFNDAGDMFTYDSDMEWDFGTPWYRPTRICHVTSGSEFGWRPGSDKWSPVWTDNQPAVLNIGQGSPTGVVYGANTRFPEKYRRSLFAFDWSFGIIYAIHLQPKGASYEAKGEEFISGSPLPLTDGTVGPDGALYFLTGGRRLESDLYRVYYRDSSKNTEKLSAPALTEAQITRRKLEEYHGAPKAGAIEFAWPYLKHEDRYIRYAARIAVEHQPLNEWKQKALAEKNPVALTEAMIALARIGEPSDKNALFTALQGVAYDKLSESAQINLIRAFELAIARLGMPDGDAKAAVIVYLNPHYPAKGGNELNRQLIKVLAFLDAPQLPERTVPLLKTAKDDNSSGQQTATNSSDLIMRNPQYGIDIAKMLAKLPPLQQTFYATALSQVKSGWTPALQEDYFKWYYEAFGFRGGHSFVGFIDSSRKAALKNVPPARFAYFNTLSGDSIVGLSFRNLEVGMRQPEGPGRNWTVEEAVAIVDSGIAGRNFERGRAIFSSSLCSSCHAIKGEGGIAGPDLTRLGTRFSYQDMLESIIEPNKAISDQYGSTVFYLKEGGSVVGRLISEDDNRYVISQNPFDLKTTREIAKEDVARTRVSEISPMLPGLINRLNAEELKDLLAYLKSGGNQQDTIFAKKK